MGNPSNIQSTSEGSTASVSEPQASSIRRRSSTSSPSVFMDSVSRAMSRVASRISMSQASRETSSRSGSRFPVLNRHSSDTDTTSVQVEENRSHMSEEEVRRTLRGTWSIKGSHFFASLSCMLGLYNISRFSMLVFLYKGPFLFQFLLLSVVLGIPFLFLMVALGQYVGSGILDMWYISPAFKGVGVALLYAYSIIGIYSAVPISWMFIYFKDSFITARESYKWAICNSKFATDVCIASVNSSKPDYAGWTVPSYFHGQVLEHRPEDANIGEVKFELAFNLTIVWFIVFITLSRGIRSYGKTVFAMNIFPISLLLVISIRFLEQWGRGVALIFAVPWKPILSDPWSWVLASREVFFTWVIFGGVILQHSSHNKSGARLTRVVVCLSIITLICLFLSAMLIACAIQALLLRGLTLSPTSFESPTVSKVLRTVAQWPVTSGVTPVNLFTGECLVPQRSSDTTSGYQSLRLATEVFPALLAMEGARRVSSFWAISFYGMLIMFGIGQQVSIWSCVVESVISLNYKKLPKWQTIVTFFLCTVGLLLGLPFTTNYGISMIHFFDFCIGSLWWIASIYLIMLIAVLLIRGRPYGTDQLVGIVTKRPRVRVWLLPILIFQWNVLLPAVFLVFSISFVRTGQEGPIDSWFRMSASYKPWAPWFKQMAFMMQVTPLLGVFVVCIYQAVRYLIPLNDLPLHQRIQALCCPVFPPSVITTNQRQGSNSGQGGSGVINEAFEEDPPPKYTPPPSYSSATAKKIASKILRHSNSFPDIEQQPNKNGPQPLQLRTTTPKVFILPSCDSEQHHEEGTGFCNSSYVCEEENTCELLQNSEPVCNQNNASAMSSGPPPYHTDEVDAYCSESLEARPAELNCSAVGDSMLEQDITTPKKSCSHFSSELQTLDKHEAQEAGKEKHSVLSNQTAQFELSNCDSVGRNADHCAKQDDFREREDTANASSSRQQPSC